MCPLPSDLITWGKSIFQANRKKEKEHPTEHSEQWWDDFHARKARNSADHRAREKTGMVASVSKQCQLCISMGGCRGLEIINNYYILQGKKVRKERTRS